MDLIIGMKMKFLKILALSWITLECMDIIRLGKLMHNRDRNQWIDYGYQADYGPMANNGKKNVAHPDVPSPFRDSFEAIDGSFGPLMNLSGKISPITGEQYIWKTGNWAKQRELKYITEDNRDRTGDEVKWRLGS